MTSIIIAILPCSLQAVHDLQPGDVVLSEEPYAAVLDFQFVYSHCSFCFKESLTLIPLVLSLAYLTKVASYSVSPNRCCHCPCEGYCSSECRVEAWRGYHWMECSVAKLWKKVIYMNVIINNQERERRTRITLVPESVQADWMMQLCLRVMLCADIEEILSAMCNQSDQSKATNLKDAILPTLIIISHYSYPQCSRIWLTVFPSCTQRQIYWWISAIAIGKGAHSIVHSMFTMSCTFQCRWVTSLLNALVIPYWATCKQQLQNHLHHVIPTQTEMQAV